MSVFILKNIKKEFKVNKKSFVVLDDISLSFPNTGLVSIIGKSGSGKSTLLNILMGIEKPTSGKVMFNGKDIYRFSDKRFSSYHLNDISLIFQHYNLFDEMTSLNNAILPLQMKGKNSRKSKREAEELFKELKIEHLIKRKVEKLSGGEKQRVAIIRALLTQPKVILCDEPTGALDYQNSQEIMAILKKKSRKMLIIMVSHNKELVNQYSDYIIEIKDGKIAHKSICKTNENDKFCKKEKHVYNGNWITKFIIKNISKNFLKNLFSIASCIVGFTSMFLCVGFIVGSESSQDEAIRKNLSIGYATISSIQTVEIKDSPLTFEKTTRPSLNELDTIADKFEIIKVEENLSYFISSYPSCNYADKTTNEFLMEPVYDLELTNYGKDMIVQGHAGLNDFDNVLVNEEFLNLFPNLKPGDEIMISNNSSITYDTLEEDNPFIKDELKLERTFTISGVVKEFPFLNSPKVYYSYIGAKHYLKNQTADNLSEYFEKRISYFDYLSIIENDDEATSYSSLLFLDNLDCSDEFFTYADSTSGTNLQITSSAYELKKTYDLFISSFSKTLIAFVAIAFIGINFILGMISLSSFIENRKNTAILTCLGSRNSSIYKIYLLENYLLIGIALISSLFLSTYLQQKLNPIISIKFALSDLIKIPIENFLGIRYGLIFLIVIIAVLFSTIFSLVPMFIYRHGFITDELRDE